MPDDMGDRRVTRAMAKLAEQVGATAPGITGIPRYGLNEDASIVVELGNGNEVRFDRQADLFVPSILMRRFALAGCDVPHLTAPKALAIAKQVLELATLVHESHVLVEYRDTLRWFLQGAANAGTRISGNLRVKQERYDRFREFRDHSKLDDGYTPAVALAIVLTDTSNGDRYVRARDVGRFMREETKMPVPWTTLHSLVIEVGWRHPGELWQREPGTKARVRINPYIVPADWEVSDLPDDPDETPETP